jgi:hypothetical protein
MTNQLPTTAAAYVRAVNGKDLIGFIALVAEYAVDDAGRIVRGREATRRGRPATSSRPT